MIIIILNSNDNNHYFYCCFAFNVHMLRCEREKYYKHCNKARNNPTKYMSIILDGT